MTKRNFISADKPLTRKGSWWVTATKGIQGRLNLTNKATDFIEVGINLNFTNSINNRLSNDNAFSNPLQSVALSPITPMIDPRTGLISGSLPGPASNYPVYYNPLLAVDNAFYKATVFRTIGKAFANVNLFKGLKFSTDFSMDNLNQNEESYYGSLTFRNTGTANGNGDNISTYVLNLNTNNFFSYNTTFGENSAFDAVLGTSYQKSTNKYSEIEGADFPSDAYKKLGSAATKVSATSSENAFSFLSYFFRGNYKYKDRYLLSFSTRVDGSSRFGESNRYGVFPCRICWLDPI